MSGVELTNEALLRAVATGISPAKQAATIAYKKIEIDELFARPGIHKVFTWPEEEFKNLQITHKLTQPMKRYMFREVAQLTPIMMRVELCRLDHVDNYRRIDEAKDIVVEFRFDLHQKVFEKIKQIISQESAFKEYKLKCKRFVDQFFQRDKLETFVKDITREFLKQLASYPDPAKAKNVKQLMSCFNVDALAQSCYDNLEESLYEINELFFKDGNDAGYKDQQKRNNFLENSDFFRIYPMFDNLADIIIGNCDHTTGDLAKCNHYFNTKLLVFFIGQIGYTEQDEKKSPLTTT